MSLETIVNKMISANEPESNIAKVIKYHKKDSSKINCKKCNHSWKVADGGDDLYMCHECGYNNNKSPLKAVATCADGSEPDEFGKCNEDKELTLAKDKMMGNINKDLETGNSNKKITKQEIKEYSSFLNRDKEKNSKISNKEKLQSEIDAENEAAGRPIDNSKEAILRRRREGEEIELDEVVVTADKPEGMGGEGQIDTTFKPEEQQNTYKDYDKAPGDFGIFPTQDPELYKGTGAGLGEDPTEIIQQKLDKAVKENKFLNSFPQNALKKNQEQRDLFQKETLKSINLKREKITADLLKKDKKQTEAFINKIYQDAGIGYFKDGKLYATIPLSSKQWQEKHGLLQNQLNEYVQKRQTDALLADEDYVSSVDSAEKLISENDVNIVNNEIQNSDAYKNTFNKLQSDITGRIDAIKEDRLKQEYGGIAGGLSEGFYETIKTTLPKAIEDYGLLRDGKRIENAKEDISKLENGKFTQNKNGGISFINKSGGVEKYASVEDAISKKQDKVKEYNNKALENLLESNKYKKEISNFSQPEIFDKDGLTVNDFTKILGTQAVQMLGAVLTGGGSTLVQEAGGALVEILTEKGASNLGVSREQFESLPEEQRNEQFMSIINSGDAELDKAMNIGIANAAVDTVGNFIAFGGISKAVPKGFLKALLRRDFKNAAAKAGAQISRRGGDSVKEAGTEVVQEVVSTGGVASALDKNVGQALFEPESLKGYAEAGGQALISTGPTVGAVSGVSNVIKSKNLRNNLPFFKSDPSKVKNAISLAEETYNIEKLKVVQDPNLSEVKKSDKIEKLNENLESQYDQIEAANQVVSNSKYRNLGENEQKIVFDELAGSLENLQNEDLIGPFEPRNKSDIRKKGQIKNRKKLKEVEELIENTGMPNPDLLASQKELQDAIAESERELLLQRSMLYSGEKGNTLIEVVNDAKEGVFKDKQVEKVKSLEDLKTVFLDEKGKVKEQFVNDVDFIDGKLVGKSKNVQLLLDGKNNGIKIGNTGIIVEENVINNIRKEGDAGSSNVVAHEVLHFITEDMSYKDLQTLKNSTLEQLKQTKDPKLQVAYAQTLERMKLYTEGRKEKGPNREATEEFFTALSDSLVDIEINDLSLEDVSILRKIGNKLKKAFGSTVKEDLDFGNMNAENTIEFIQRYNNFNKETSGKIKGVESKTKTKTKKPVRASKPLTKEELATEFSTLEKGKIPDETAVQAAYAYEPLAKSIANTMYRDYPGFKESGFTKDDFAMALAFGEGANSLVGLAKSYDPKVGSIGGYFSEFLPQRAKAVMNKFIGKSATNAGTSLDTTEARELEADEKVDIEAKNAAEALAVSKPITDITTDKKTMELATLAAANALKKLPKKATVKQQTTAKIKAFDGFVGRTLDLELKEILKKTKNQNEFDKFLNNEWEFIGNAFLDNTDIGKIRNEQTRELLEGWEDNGFTKKDVFDYFNDPNLAKNTRSDRKNVGLIKVLRAELGDIMRINIAKNDPATAADFKKSTGIPLASRPLSEIARQNAYLKANLNAPQTLPYSSIEKLIAANSDFKKVPVLDTPEKAIEFVKSLKDLVFSLPLEIVTKTGFYNPSGRIFPNYDKNKKWINSKGNTTGRFKNNAARAKAAGYFLNKSEGRKKFEAIETAFNTERDALIKDLKANSTVKLYGAAKGFTAYKFADLMGSTPAEILNNKDKILDQNVKAMAMHEQVWKPLYEFIKKDPKNNAAPVGFLLKNGSKTATHWHRAGIEMVGTSKKFEGGFTYEHAMPMVSAYLALIDSAAKNVPFDISYPAVQSNYKLLALSKKDDNKLKGPYKAGMGDGWNFYTGNWKERYFNATVGNTDGGINPASIIDLNGENYAKKYNIDNKGFSTTTKALASKPLSRTFYEDGDGVSQIQAPLSQEFNKMLENTKGVKAEAVYSDARASKMGVKKGFQVFVPYSAEDFLGLVYPTLGKGKQGDKDLKWWKDNVMNPYNDGMTEFESSKQAAMIEWNQIKDQIKNTPNNLGKEAVRDFSNEDAVRVYLWDQQDAAPSDLSKKDIKALVDYVKKSPELTAFAGQINSLNVNGYPDPTKGWLAGTITTDLVNHVNTSTRSEMLAPWQEAIDDIYTDDNKNKLKATYGEKYIEALDDVLYRMKTGRNRPSGANRITNNWLNWVNDSVGTIMFFNQRSAILQTISSINFINWSDNNPGAAAKAFANQKQYWSDFSYLFNSDFLKQRRSGLKTDVNADEIAQQAAGSTNKVRAGLSFLLKKGFYPTQIADSFAIASGGSTFYRNRVSSLVKSGMSKVDAEKQAFADFRESANDSQQSSDPSKVSMEQASSLGRVILAFANTPIQYTRLTKRATQDLIAGRGDWKTNVSKIVYYGAVQNIIFTTLQQAMFGMLFADDDDEFQNSKKDTAVFNVANSTVDTFLRGSGVAGAFVAMLKNMALEIKRQKDSKRPDYTKVADKLFTVSPPIDSKFRKLKSAGRAFTYKQELEKMRNKGIAIDNPAFMAIAQVISAFGNIPADRVLRKLNNIVEATNSKNAIWQRIGLAMGWGEWELGITDRKTKEAKEERDSFKALEKSITRATKAIAKEKA